MSKSTITRDELNEVIATYGKHHIAHQMANALLAAMDSEPVADTPQPQNAGICAPLGPSIRMLCPLEPGTNLYRHAQQPVDSEPVGYLFHNEYGAVLYSISDDATEGFSLIGPIYSVPQPAPVVPDEKDKTVDADDHPLLWSFNEGWNACRADMLQELKKSAGTEAICRSDENAQVLNIIKAPPALDSLPKTGEVQNTNPPENPGCWCRTCRPVVLNDMRFVVCPDCGNKRCPRANDHRNACTGSNEPGQEGSAYPDAPREVK